MALLPLTREEEEALADLEVKTQELRSAQRAIRGFHSDPDAETEVKKLEDTVNALTESEPVLSAMVKKALNEAAEKVLPGGSVSPYITIAEDLVGTIDRPNGQRVQALLKQVVLKFLSMAGDADINRARAEALKARYDALLKAGFDKGLVAQIIVAERGRTVSINLPDRKSK